MTSRPPGFEYISPETKSLIVRMCSYLDDKGIARHLGCELATVKRIRAKIIRRKRGRPPRQAHVIATKSEIHNASIVRAERQRNAAMAKACEKLLRRQLETGQHMLTPDKFYDICIAKGWMEPEAARKSGS